MVTTAIYYFAGIKYNFLRQRPQQLFDSIKNTTEAQCFFVEPPHSTLVSAPSPFIIRTGLRIPGNRLKIIRALNQSVIARQVRWYCNKYSRNIAIVSSWFWEQYVGRETFDMIIYDHLDSLDVHALDDRPETISLHHRQLISKSDIVFTTAQALFEDVKAIDPTKEVIVLSNGVDVDFFQSKSNANVPLRKQRPIVGYVGALSRWVDFELVSRVADRMKDVDFVMLGPVEKEAEVRCLRSRTNVHLLGLQPYELVPAYVNLFDVAIIPFKGPGISKATNPIKLYEYFALGKPVVSTPLRELERYNTGRLMRVASDDAAFASDIRCFLESDSIACKHERQLVAGAHSWRERAKIIVDKIVGHAYED